MRGWKSNCIGFCFTLYNTQLKATLTCDSFAQNPSLMKLTCNCEIHMLLKVKAYVYHLFFRILIQKILHIRFQKGAILLITKKWRGIHGLFPPFTKRMIYTRKTSEQGHPVRGREIIQIVSLRKMKLDTVCLGKGRVHLVLPDSGNMQAHQVGIYRTHYQDLNKKRHHAKVCCNSSLCWERELSVAVTCMCKLADM